MEFKWMRNIVIAITFMVICFIGNMYRGSTLDIVSGMTNKLKLNSQHFLAGYITAGKNGCTNSTKQDVQAIKTPNIVQTTRRLKNKAEQTTTQNLHDNIKQIYLDDAKNKADSNDNKAGNIYDTVPEISETNEYETINDNETSPAEKKRILLVSYMRGGSSYMATVLESHPDVFYWYEPMFGIYRGMVAAPPGSHPALLLYNNVTGQPRNFTTYERSQVAYQLDAILNCEFSDLPVELLSYDYFPFSKMDKKTKDYKQCLNITKSMKKDLQKCLSKVGRFCISDLEKNFEQCNLFLSIVRSNILMQLWKKWDPLLHKQFHGINGTDPIVYKRCMKEIESRVQWCVPYLENTCIQSRIQMAKVIRIRFDTIQTLIENHPNTYVIHETRDPRGIMMSRNRTHLLSTKSIHSEAKMLCHKMMQDHDMFKKLVKIFPGRLLQVRYEDLADKTHIISKAMFRFLKEEPPMNPTRWVQYEKLENPFHTFRYNPSKTAHLWKNNISLDMLRIINCACKDVLEAFDYEKLPDLGTHFDTDKEVLDILLDEENCSST